ncbi:unnamed protein product, partial [marine sediment metagenome]
DGGYGGILCYAAWTVAGQTGRPFESEMLNNVLLGGYANALKGYMNCDASGGSTGLLSGVNGEIRLPNGAGRGAYFALEGEVVLQQNSTTNPWGSSTGFLYLGASGHATGLIDFNTNGRFMVIMGLSPGIGELLSLDYHTLKCTLDLTLDKYLVLSKEENIISHSFTAIVPDGRIMRLLGTWDKPNTPDGVGLIEVQIDISGIATGSACLSALWANLGASADIPAYLFLRNDGIWDAGTADLVTASIAMQKYQCLLGSNPGYL